METAGQAEAGSLGNGGAPFRSRAPTMGSAGRVPGGRSASIPAMGAQQKPAGFLARELPEAAVHEL